MREQLSWRKSEDYAVSGIIESSADENSPSEVLSNHDLQCSIPGSMDVKFEGEIADELTLLSQFALEGAE